MTDDCLFCKILVKDVPAEVVYENDSGILAVFKRKYLRVILSNHKQYRIGADLLRKKDWFQMKQEFEKINIPVRVEF